MEWLQIWAGTGRSWLPPFDGLIRNSVGGRKEFAASVRLIDLRYGRGPGGVGCLRSIDWIEIWAGAGSSLLLPFYGLIIDMGGAERSSLPSYVRLIRDMAWTGRSSLPPLDRLDMCMNVVTWFSCSPSSGEKVQLWIYYWLFEGARCVSRGSGERNHDGRLDSYHDSRSRQTPARGEEKAQRGLGVL